MELIKDSVSATYNIQNYTPGTINISDQEYSHSILLMPERLSPWAVSHPESLTINHIESLLDYKPEIVIIGTGDKVSLPNSELMTPITTQGIGCEMMSTLAACRTYTILMAQMRNVLAALIIEPVV